MVVSEVLANTSNSEQITKVEQECVLSDEHLSKIDRLNGLVYARREY